MLRRFTLHGDVLFNISSLLRAGLQIRQSPFVICKFCRFFIRVGCNALDHRLRQYVTDQTQIMGSLVPGFGAYLNE